MLRSKFGAGAKGTAAHWETLENGTQMTASPQLLKKALGRLKKKRELITLAHKGYQSNRTVLLDYDDSLLQIDKPRDWPGTHTFVYILFKDDTQVWNRIKAEVKKISSDTLYLEFPRELVRLQRRSNYRVDPPLGSMARFIRKGEEYSAQKIMDISADGMLIAAPGKGLIFDLADELSAISLFFPGEGAGFSAGTAISINRGVIVRVARDDHYSFCYGVHFDLDHSEEIALLQYVRQRERELLRRGLADE